MTTTVGALCPWINEQYTDDAGVPLSGGLIEFFVSGSATHKDTFSTSDLDPAGKNSNPVVLDSAGRAPVAIFFEAGLYDATISDVDSVLLKTVSGIGTPSAAVANEVVVNLGPTLTAGARNVTSGYTVLSSDVFITVNSTGGADPCIINLPAAATRGQSICIKNLGNVALSVKPNGSDTIEGSLSAWQVNASGTPNFAVVWLFPDGTSSWWMFSKTG